MKTCYKCKIEKPLEEFIKYHKSKDGFKNLCKSCMTLQNKDYYNRNKIDQKERSKIFYYNNKEYYSNKAKENRLDNLDHYREYSTNYKKERVKNDELFAFTIKIRKNVISYMKGLKNKKTEEILGCSFEFFKNYIEEQFEYWMNWENYGKYNGEFNYGWDLDHIISLSNAMTIDELIKLNHYTNIRPLCSKINRYVKRNH